MSENAESTTPETEEVPVEETPETPETTDTTAEDTTEDTSETPNADVERLEKELEKVRKEAAKYRTRARDAEAAAKNADPEAHAKALEELEGKVAETTTQLEAAGLAALKVETALAALFPEQRDQVVALAGLLQGSNAEEIQKHAETVTKTLLTGAVRKPRAVDPSQGSGGSVKADVAPGMSRIAAAYDAKGSE